MSPYNTQYWVAELSTQSRSYRTTRLCPYGLLVIHYSIRFIFRLSVTPPLRLSHLIYLHVLPIACEIDPLLIPPPPRQPLYHPSLHFQAQVYNGPSCYVLDHCVMPSKNVRFQFIQPCLPHQLCQWGVLPSPIGFLPRLFPCYPP